MSTFSVENVVIWEKIWVYFFRSLENGHFVVLKYTEKTAPGIKTSVKEERKLLPSFWCSRNCVKLSQSKVMSRTSWHFCKFRIRLDRVHDRIKFTIGSGLGLKRVTIGIAFNTGSGLRLNRVSRLNQVYDWIGFRIESSNHWNRVKYWIRFTVEWRFTIRSRFTIGSGLGLVPFFYTTSYHWNRVYDWIKLTIVSCLRLDHVYDWIRFTIGSDLRVNRVYNSIEIPLESNLGAMMGMSE